MIKMSDSFELKDKFEKIFIIIQHLSHDDFFIRILPNIIQGSI